MKKTSELKLLQKYSSIIKELKKRGILRTTNNPVADYAEYIVAKKLKLDLVTNSFKSFDAMDKNKKTYQIKSRRIMKTSNSLQLGIMRSLNFDFLIVVIFNEDFTVFKSYLIPQKIIKSYAKFSNYQSGYILRLNSGILKDKMVKTFDI